MRFHTRFTLTFDGSATAGAAGVPITFMDVYGTVRVHDVVIAVTNSLTPTGGTVTLTPTSVFGATQNTTALITGAIWSSTGTPGAGIGTISGRSIILREGATAGSGEFVITPNTTTLTAGTMVMDVFWEPISAGATVGLVRNKYQQPFPATSIWNQPLRASAVYVACSFAAASVSPAYVGIDEDILQLDATAGLVDTVGYSTIPWPGSNCLRCSGDSGNATSGQKPWPPTFYVCVDEGTSPNNPGALILTDGDTIHQTQPIHRCPGTGASSCGGGCTGTAKGKITYWKDNGMGNAMSLSTGDGIAGAQGGSGMSSIGGTIRLGELIPGGQIRHALKINVDAASNLSAATQSSAWTVGNSSAANPTQITITGHPFQTGESITFAGHSKAGVNGAHAVTYINANTVSIAVDLSGGGGTGGTAKRTYPTDGAGPGCYRWPASTADTGAAGEYAGSVPEFRMGSLVALKTTFNVAALNTEPARIIARALQLYGAYVVDSTSWNAKPVAWGIERSPTGSVKDEFLSAWGYPMKYEGASSGAAHLQWVSDNATIIAALYVVDNNTSTSIGGGTSTTTLAPYAAPLA